MRIAGVMTATGEMAAGTSAYTAKILTGYFPVRPAPAYRRRNVISEEEYQKATVQMREAEEIISTYYKEQVEAFRKRLAENPIFTDEELRYSATALCPCGHGLAYPKNCEPNYHWDCSAILKGIADDKDQHTALLPFVFYKVTGESERNGTTRGVRLPARHLFFDGAKERKQCSPLE
jgi:hypothetical protein